MKQEYEYESSMVVVQQKYPVHSEIQICFCLTSLRHVSLQMHISQGELRGDRGKMWNRVMYILSMNGENAFGSDFRCFSRIIVHAVWATNLTFTLYITNFCVKRRTSYVHLVPLKAKQDSQVPKPITAASILDWLLNAMPSIVAAAAPRECPIKESLMSDFFDISRRPLVSLCARMSLASTVINRLKQSIR